jgi:hypothetical protein
MFLLITATLLALIVPAITFGVFALERWQNWRAARGRVKSSACETSFRIH